MALFWGAIIEDTCAQFRHQRRKLRRLAAELLAEFRSQARIPSMIAPSKTVFFSIYRFFNIILTWPWRTTRIFASVLRRRVLVVEGEDVVDVVGAISHIDKLSGLKYVREVLEQGGMNAELLTYESTKLGIVTAGCVYGPEQ